MNLIEYREKIFSNISDFEFEELSIFAFRFQYENNSVYRNYCDFLKVNPDSIKNYINIPFLPIPFFKTKQVVSCKNKSYTIFESSSTTGIIPSKHFVSDVVLYEKAFNQAFNLFYGNPKNYVILALLPSYIERRNASLIYMVNGLLKKAKPGGGFFLSDYTALYDEISKNEKSKTKYLLIGVSFALLEFASNYSIGCKHGIIMETGGMKGRGEEITRERLHKILTKSFGVSAIHSEYGMTELLSQAYSKADGKYFCPPWMKVLLRETTDPRSVHSIGNGALNIIDLANINSCCFIETSDLGAVDCDGSFTVSGRFDFADVRGCNLMSV
ncbi:MAG TPA: acyltransferase [Bacteroidales bacterium]|nr:acyltransferase [Bacteroidales bacterium]